MNSSSRCVRIVAWPNVDRIHSGSVCSFRFFHQHKWQPEQAEEGMEGGKLQLAKHLYLCFRRRKHNKCVYFAFCYTPQPRFKYAHPSLDDTP